MKASKAPERIYVHIKDKPFEITFSEVIEKGCSNIEYIHADTFIEKACEWIKKNLLKHTYVYEGEVDIGMGVFLEEFKQAMKG